MRVLSILLLVTLGAVLAPTRPAAAGTELVQKDGKYQLLRDGKPYLIKGVGGSGSKELLKAMGGNSFRTWGADDIGAELDEAHRLGLTVTVGIWLEHERHGFNYNDDEFVARQLDKVRKQVLKYKDHPAVLMWAIGNEMEGEKGNNAAIWSHIDSCAALVKSLDPTRPTMTVVAELGGNKQKNVHRLCPNIDIIGVNSYAGASSLVKRYRLAGGTKPLVITEFGPFGTWETEKNSFGALPEPTSTDKAKFYRDHYIATVKEGEGLVLGSYAFTWGAKLEMTATWFGMLLPDGSKLGAVDAVSTLWTGKPPANQCPTISPIKLGASQKVAPGAVLDASVIAADPDGDQLTYQWVLQEEVAKPGVGGDAEHAPPVVANAVSDNATDHANVQMPSKSGRYRLYVYVRDGKGSAATANVPLLVSDEVSSADKTADAPSVANAAVPAAKLPFVIYSDDLNNPPYTPSGWMGKLDAIAVDDKCRDDPHSGNTCMKLQFSSPDNFGGVVWQSPANDWGDKPGGHDIRGAKKLSFWARGSAGGEQVEFKFGVLGKEKTHPDSDGGAIILELTPKWTRYEIDLAGRDLSQIKTGFCWVLAGQGRPVTFYLDDIQYE